MINSHRKIAVLLLVSTVMISSKTVAQEIQKPADDAKEIKDGKGKWVPLFQRHANEYVITTENGEEAQRLADPLLRWWQPIRGGDDGALYLWTSQGRPVAAVTFFTFKMPTTGERVIVHERHSFSQGPIRGSWRDQAPWRPSQPGLVFKPMPDAPSPAETPAARLRQMQSLVREISATTTDDKGSTWTMRPLNKPLHRYEALDQKIRDGAIFTLAQGTDPEAFFFLEARGVGKDTHWEYAVARFTDMQLRVEIKGQLVFSGPHSLGSPKEIYYVNSALTKVSDSPDDFQ